MDAGIKLKVGRPFLLGSVRQEVGSFVEVSPALAAELVAMGKASRVDPAPVKTGPMTTDSAGGLVPGPKRAKESSNDGKSSAGV